MLFSHSTLEKEQFRQTPKSIPSIVSMSTCKLLTAAVVLRQSQISAQSDCFTVRLFKNNITCCCVIYSDLSVVQLLYTTNLKYIIVVLYIILTRVFVFKVDTAYFRNLITEFLKYSEYIMTD